MTRPCERAILEGMKEAQGPTPAGTSKPYRSLTEALRAHRIDPVNHAFIEAIVDAVEVTSFIDRGRYIEALRRGEGAPLHIGKTYTNGFTADEQIRVGGAVVRLQPSEGREPYFYAEHPSEWPGVVKTVPKRAAARREPTPRVAPKPKPIERDYGVCDVCFMAKSPSGACGCD